jgi:hypothetical protein
MNMAIDLTQAGGCPGYNICGSGKRFVAPDILFIANHIQRFCAPSKPVRLIALVAQGDPQIHPLVNIAVTQLSDYSAPN